MGRQLTTMLRLVQFVKHRYPVSFWMSQPSM